MIVLSKCPIQSVRDVRGPPGPKAAFTMSTAFSVSNSRSGRIERNQLEKSQQTAAPGLPEPQHLQKDLHSD